MGRCYSHCVEPSWRVFSYVRRWYWCGDRVQAVVYEHAQCRACSALATLAYDVDAFELCGRPAAEESAQPFQTFQFDGPSYGQRIAA